ncbi:hypothetical protein E1B28_010614 [Marasmius oreades]|uniref:Uncharacterized protein n=1 Tax=Marasmius oreades TaxID=181124 RepID=A0A9P7URN9_9AGAR|nr:uncharacterized protein E1B28_010614 [Marasmius oreades]KAG7091593.1 hypothetical protein E1B28_010614 [Marasmius oreades]
MPPCGTGSLLDSACYTRVITRPAASLALQFVLYGAYAILFGICLFTLTTRKLKLPYSSIHIAAVTTLFAVGTISLSLNTTIIVRTATMSLAPIAFSDISLAINANKSVNEILEQQRVLIPCAHMLLVLAKYDILSLQESIHKTQKPPLSSIADAILVWRCYMIWAYNRKVTAFPALFCFVNNFLGITTSALYIKNGHVEQFFQVPHTDSTSTVFTVFIFGTLFSNLLITAMIAGRITYLAHKSKAFLVPDYWRMYRAAISITLESGMLLPLAIVVYAVAALQTQKVPNTWVPSASLGVMETVAEVMFYALVQFVGIAPTLIIVRIGLGVSVEGRQQDSSPERHEMRADMRVE